MATVHSCYSQSRQQMTLLDEIEEVETRLLLFLCVIFRNKQLVTFFGVWFCNNNHNWNYKLKVFFDLIVVRRLGTREKPASYSREHYQVRIVCKTSAPSTSAVPPYYPYFLQHCKHYTQCIPHHISSKMAALVIYFNFWANKIV